MINSKTFDINYLNNVKVLLGIYYDEPTKDLEIYNLIEIGHDFLLNAGWQLEKINNNSSLNAITLYIKMFWLNELNFLNNKMLIALIIQNRY